MSTDTPSIGSTIPLRVHHQAPRVVASPSLRKLTTGPLYRLPGLKSALPTWAAPGFWTGFWRWSWWEWAWRWFWQRWFFRRPVWWWLWCSYGYPPCFQYWQRRLRTHPVRRTKRSGTSCSPGSTTKGRAPGCSPRRPAPAAEPERPPTRGDRAFSSIFTFLSLTVSSGGRVSSSDCTSGRSDEPPGRNSGWGDCSAAWR